jgi:hypothetical protein
MYLEQATINSLQQRKHMYNELLSMKKQVYEINKKNGFWEEAPTRFLYQERVMLIITELSEAVEALRKGKLYNPAMFPSNTMSGTSPEFLLHVKDTVGDEVADAVIRLLDTIEGFELNVLPNVDTTLWTNADRFQPPSFTAHVFQIIKNIFTGNSFPVGEVLLADLITLAYHYKIPLMQHVKWKLEYNATRPYKHGKQF